MTLLSKDVVFVVCCLLLLLLLLLYCTHAVRLLPAYAFMANLKLILLRDSSTANATAKQRATKKYVAYFFGLNLLCSLICTLCAEQRFINIWP